MSNPLRFRQVHLDFHTSGAIAGIGERFDKRAFQEMLTRAEVNSITLFATCHHGWSYYDTQVGKRHPGLSFDLLRAQFDACKEIGINAPIYLTAGVHNMIAEEQPGWRIINPDGSLGGWAKSPLEPGFKMLSFHSPYLDYLCEQICEVVTLFPKADGIFLDIISQNEDCSEWALRYMQERGLDPLKAADRQQSRHDALMKYYQRSTAAVRSLDPDMPVFHNSGSIPAGCHEILPYFSHLEAESLPTGGWGYDHFPLSAKYLHQLDMDFLGMTGKFHSTWGEFGGTKHPNALRYECCAMLAYGARCSVGDQLHPTGQLDASTYAVIGEAYREVARKEAYVEGARNVADIALLSNAAMDSTTALSNPCREYPSEVGAARVLLEAHLLFDVIDTQMDFDRYRMLVLADDICPDAALATKLNSYLASGGKLFLSGASGIGADGTMLFDTGAEVGAASEFTPDYILPIASLQPDFVSSPMVMYGRSQRLRPTDGEALGDVYDPYFNRAWNHFSSHQHTPPRPEPSGFACGSRKGNVLHLAHPVFAIYRSFGQVALRQYIAKSLRLLLASGERLHLKNFPSTARVTLMHQRPQRRYVLHLLNATPINRGGEAALHGGNVSASPRSYEVIEDINPLHNIGIDLQLDEAVRSVRTEPEGTDLPFTSEGGRLRFTLPALGHHQMVVLGY